MKHCPDHVILSFWHKFSSPASLSIGAGAGAGAGAHAVTPVQPLCIIYIYMIYSLTVKNNFSACMRKQIVDGGDYSPVDEMRKQKQRATSIV